MDFPPLRDHCDFKHGVGRYIYIYIYGSRRMFPLGNSVMSEQGNISCQGPGVFTLIVIIFILLYCACVCERETVQIQSSQCDIFGVFKLICYSTNPLICAFHKELNQECSSATAASLLTHTHTQQQHTCTVFFTL